MITLLGSVKLSKVVDCPPRFFSLISAVRCCTEMDSCRLHVDSLSSADSHSIFVHDSNLRIRLLYSVRILDNILPVIEIPLFNEWRSHVTIHNSLYIYHLRYDVSRQMDKQCDMMYLDHLFARHFDCAIETREVARIANRLVGMQLLPQKHRRGENIASNKLEASNSVGSKPPTSGLGGAVASSKVEFRHDSSCSSAGEVGFAHTLRA